MTTKLALCVLYWFKSLHRKNNNFKWFNCGFKEKITWQWQTRVENPEERVFMMFFKILFRILPFSFPIHLWISVFNFLIMWNEKQLFKFVNLLIPLRFFSLSFKWFKIQSLSMQKKRKRNKIKIFFVPKSYTKEPHPQVKWLHSINSANERSKNKHFNIFCLIWAHENGIKC